MASHHDEPRDEGSIPHILQMPSFNIILHLQVKEQTLIHDVRQPAAEQGEWVSFLLFIQTSLQWTDTENLQ